MATNPENDDSYFEMTKTINHTYDSSVDAAYIYLTDIPDGAVAETYTCEDLPEQVKGSIHLDFDMNGKLLGIEILDSSKVLPKEFSS